MQWRRWVSAAGDLVLGACCPGCEEPGWGLCAPCRSALARFRPGPHAPTPAPEGFPTTVAAGPYDEVVRRLVTAHKERQALTLTPVLAGRLALSIEVLLDGPGGRASRRGPVWLVPVPSAARAVRERGFDATGSMARHSARLLPPGHAVVVWPVLVQRRGVADQAGLDAADRAANLRGAVRLARGPVRGHRLGGGRLLAEPPPGSPVVLVDDVVTTGSSLAESARVLREGGFTVLGAATVAATRRRGPAPGATRRPCAPGSDRARSGGLRSG